jgi:hypothetical protein
VVCLRSLKDGTFVGGPPHPKCAPVKVRALQRQDLAEAQASIGEGTHHCLMGAGPPCKAVHHREVEDAHRASALSDPRVAGAHMDALERISLGDLVGDRVLGHRRESAQDRGGTAGGPALDPEQVVYEPQRMATA